MATICPPGLRISSRGMLTFGSPAGAGPKSASSIAYMDMSSGDILMSFPSSTNVQNLGVPRRFHNYLRFRV